MNIKSGNLVSILVVALVLSAQIAFIATGRAESDDRLAAGKELAFDRTKGNCLACHIIEDGESPGTIAPPLVAMKVRYPDKARLREQIADARIKNPLTMMPPFGPHKILTDEEIDLIVDYVYSL